MDDLDESIKAAGPLRDALNGAINEAEKAALRIPDAQTQARVLQTVRYCKRLLSAYSGYLGLASRISQNKARFDRVSTTEESELIRDALNQITELQFQVSALSRSIVNDSLPGLVKQADGTLSVLRLIGESIATGLSSVAIVIDKLEDIGVHERDVLAGTVHSISLILESEGNAVLIRQANDEAQQVLYNVRETASATGDAKLGEFFKTYGDRERRAARLLRYVASFLLLMTAIGAAAIVFLLQGHGLQGGIWQQLAKLAVVLPVGILAGYLGRESTKHREAAQWAEEMRIQLLTFDAFVEAMDPDDAKHLRATFGARVFAARMVTGPKKELNNAVNVAADLASKFNGSK